MVSTKQAVNEIIIEEMDRACLEQALTISEVCGLYHKTSKTVTVLCKSGRLVSRQAEFGTTWLVSRRSCDERWRENGKLRSSR